MTTETPQSAPKLQTDLDVADIPAIYRRFTEVISVRAWTHRVHQIKGAIKGNPFLSDYLHAENDIAFALDRCGNIIAKYGRLPDTPDATRLLYPGISLAAQTLSMMDIATKLEAERLRKRVVAAFANPDDMRAYRLELTVATHFARRGWSVAWPEMVRNGETFDVLTTSPNGNELEVECKSVSGDKGRKIHRREALDFNHFVAKELASFRKTLKAGLAVVLTVPKKLPTTVSDRRLLAKRIRQQIHHGSGERFVDGADIRISEFDPTLIAGLRAAGDAEGFRSFIDTVTRTQNRESMVLGTSNGGAIVFVVQSADDDSFLDATFETLGDAAKRQFTGHRAGLLIAGFHDVDGEQLISIAEQDYDPQQRPTALARGVSRFLSSESRDHVIGVGFVSRSSLRPVAPGLTDSGGAAYYFARRESSMWNEEFSGLFRWRSEPAPKLSGIVMPT